VADFRPATAEQESFLAELLAAGLLIPRGVPGVYGRSSGFEDVRERVDAVVTRAAAPDAAERLRFPPLVPRRQFEATGYLKSFPHRAGTVFAFEGSEAEALELEDRASQHQDWSEFQSMSDLVLVPAACYPVYPAIAARGRLAPGGTTIDAGGAYVFRNEPSGDPARLQMFHQREMVRIGEPDEVSEWRDLWRDRAIELLRGLELEAEFDVATDPFFGRSGRMMAASQRQQALKFEISVPLGGPELTAVASFNYHQTHFAEVYGIELADGGVAHTSCLGFGLERIAMALFRAHGLEPESWPSAVRKELWPR
jgi:seryl-tRNA synthetase